MKIAVYPGTFDPITNGHLDIITRASHLFDEVIVGVAANLQKKPLFSLEKRIHWCMQSVVHLLNVRVFAIEKLTVDFAKTHSANYIVRGMRTISDMDYEIAIANMNAQLSQAQIETVFLAAHDQYRSSSSSLVREIMMVQGDVSAFVPQCVMKNGFKNN